MGIAPPSEYPRVHESTLSSDFRSMTRRFASSRQCEQAGFTSVLNASGLITTGGSAARHTHSVKLKTNIKPGNRNIELPLSERLFCCGRSAITAPDRGPNLCRVLAFHNWTDSYCTLTQVLDKTLGVWQGNALCNGG